VSLSPRIALIRIAIATINHMSSATGADSMSKPAAASSSDDSDQMSFSISQQVERVVADSLIEIETLDEASRNQTAAYRTLKGRAEAELISFDTPDHRVAYIRVYVRSHALMLTQVLQQCKVASDALLEVWKRGERLDVVSVGGGPGSDVLGVCKFAEMNHCMARGCVSFVILDRQTDWMYDWLSVTKKMPAYFHSTYGHFDASNANDVAKCPKLFSDCHLVTMVKFASAIHASNPVPFYTAMFDALRPGTIVVLVDNWCPANREDSFTTDCKKAADKAGMTCLLKNSAMEVMSETYENELAELASAIKLSQGNNHHKPYYGKKMLVYVWMKPTSAPVAPAEDQKPL